MFYPFVPFFAQSWGPTTQKCRAPRSRGADTSGGREEKVQTGFRFLRGPLLVSNSTQFFTFLNYTFTLLSRSPLSSSLTCLPSTDTPFFHNPPSPFSLTRPGSYRKSYFRPEKSPAKVPVLPFPSFVRRLYGRVVSKSNGVISALWSLGWPCLRLRNYRFFIAGLIKRTGGEDLRLDWRFELGLEKGKNRRVEHVRGWVLEQGVIYTDRNPIEGELFD